MDKATVEEIIQYLKSLYIQSGLKVNSIALFGSALSGEIRPGSDLDLIIISDDFENKDIFQRAKMTMNPEVQTLRKFMVPMDILNMTPSEYEESQIKKFYQSKIVA
jgi:predicted nucleotidyltransferase